MLQLIVIGGEITIDGSENTYHFCCQVFTGLSLFNYKEVNIKFQK